VQRIEVAVGVIFNQEGNVLVGQRTVEDRYFQKWEFPGGKLEKGESPAKALARELYEELAISVESCSELMTLEHDYPDRCVRLYVQVVESYKGAIQGKEGQALKWVALRELADLDVLQGNQPIVERLMGR